MCFVVVVLFCFILCVESIVSILDRKDNKAIIDDVTFDICATYIGCDRKVLSVDMQCDDSRVTESMIQHINEAFDVLKNIILLSLPNTFQVPLDFE